MQTADFLCRIPARAGALSPSTRWEVAEVSNRESGKPFADARLWGADRWLIGVPAKNANMRVADDVLHCVVFIGAKISRDGVERFHLGGTGFFVSVPGDEPDSLLVFLVTAKHNIEKAKQFGDGDLYIRLNTVDGRYGLVKISIPWHYSEDEAVDIAVLAITPPHDIFEYRHIFLDTFANEEVLDEYGIGIGEEIILPGLFTQRQGNKRNIPIVRSGIIAAMPDEELEDLDTGLPYHAYLAEVRSIGGLSGSPVFAMLPAGRRHAGVPTGYRGILIGLVRGHWDLERRPMEYGDEPMEAMNMGIAIITPIKELINILFGEEITRLRKEADRKAKLRRQATQDSET